ncbi:hypothetical protein N7510_011275 [Penicillium lagena]|uniref:uncharacterized protein n=1 Tax=Penicillium lagena TaxID=94218 RepID=UPI002541C396|nr:uncharacterized protein N7510_011275 [Penicillium lagena]KAJ5601741.1 hypothetical protein N7510_011275 [Penicillium lagena]
MIAVNGCRILQIVTASFFAWVFLTTFLGYLSDNATWPKNLSSISSKLASDKAFAHIQNETLGFGHVYAIGLKERADKRDFLTLAASETGFKVEWLDGVLPSSLQQKAMPSGYNISATVPAIIACWRAHMNFLLDVIENEYSSALVLEDDADWDVNIKSQLHEFARGLHALQGESKVSKQHPYGTDWDLLWIGGCGSAPFPNETKFYAIPDDPTCPNIENRITLGGVPDNWKTRFPDDSTRFLFKAEAGCCTYGYAVSNKGAKKILAQLELDHIDTPVDLALSDLCGGKGRRQIDCYAPFPQIIGTYRQAGPSSRLSDISSSEASEIREESSVNVGYSTRLNIQRLAAGDATVFSQWDNQPWTEKEISVQEFVYPRGYLVN